MIKSLKNIIGVIAGLLMAQNAYAALFTTGFDTYNAPYLNAVNLYSESRSMTSLITSGSLSYEDTDGSGFLNINSSSALHGNMQINNAALTTNNDGSLHVTGAIDFLTLGSSASFFGDIAITANWDEFNDVTTFEFGPIAFTGSNHNGLFITDGLFAGDLLEFYASSSLLAYVDNPFPVYSPVPVPAALWLFASGLIGLAGFAKRNTA